MRLGLDLTGLDPNIIASRLFFGLLHRSFSQSFGIWSLSRCKSVCQESEARLSFFEGSIRHTHLSGCLPAKENSDLILSKTDVLGSNLLDFLASEISTNIIIQSNDDPQLLRRDENQFVISSLTNDLYTSISVQSVQYVWSIGCPVNVVILLRSFDSFTLSNGTNLERTDTDFDGLLKFRLHSIFSFGSPSSSRDFKLSNNFNDEPVSRK